MLQPNAKDWIDKYFHLVESGEINLQLNFNKHKADTADYLHNLFFQTGIIFDFPIQFIFYNDEEVTSKWTESERSSFLLFECLLTVYSLEHKSSDMEAFVDTLLLFYKEYNNRSSINIFKKIFKESKTDKLEYILRERSHIKANLANRLWANYIENNLTYLDVIAFRLFLLRKKEIHESYDGFVKTAIQTIGYMSVADDTLTNEEQKILDIYISSAALTKEEKAAFRQKIDEKSFQLEDIDPPSEGNRLFKHYLMDLAILTVHADLSVISDEIVQLNDLCAHLRLTANDMKHSMILIERFVMQNEAKIPFLQDKSAYERLYGNFANRWVKILGRNKDKFIEELRESKELISLVNKSMTEELTAEEKEKVKEQFKNLAKSLPAIAIFMLPGGAVLLPIVLKIVPNLIPSAFKQNEI